MNSNSNNHPDLDSDARIDAMARAAGGELRRPAPTEGLARARATSRRRHTVRAVAGGAAAVALLSAGVFAVTRGDDDQRVVPADTTVETSTTSISPDGAGDLEALYSTTGFIASPDYLQTVIDPITGNVLGTGAPDSEASMQAQLTLIDQFVYDGESASLPGVLGYRLVSGDIAYTYGVRGTDSPDLANEDPAVLARFDRCEQSELTVEGADRGALPARVQRLTMSLDRRWLAVVSSECPVDGTLVGQERVVASTSTVQVFDAAHPDRPGLQLMTTTERIFFRSLFFSPDGNYLAVDDSGYRVFDVADGSEVQLAPGGCDVFGGRYAMSSGPWVGDSSLLFSVSCPDTAALTVIDVATDETLVVPAPSPTRGAALTVEVDVAHYDRPQNAWFTMCASSAEASTCWYGQGSSQPVEIPGAQEASFLPLGFTFGG